MNYPSLFNSFISNKYINTPFYDLEYNNISEPNFLLNHYDDNNNVIDQVHDQVHDNKIHIIPWIDFHHQIIYREKHDRRILVITSINELMKININNWEYNRPIDKTRLPDIIRNNKHKTLLEGIIYLFKCKQKYFCYDGIHRLSCFHNMNPDCKIIVDIMLDPSQGTIVDKFTHINQTISVPELYTNNMFEHDKKKIILDVVQHYMNKYKLHFSPKQNYNIPNCNREVMTDKLYQLMSEDICKEHFTKDEWILYLTRVETIIREKIEDTNNNRYKLSKKQYEKCIKNDFFLFAIKNWEDVFPDE